MACCQFPIVFHSCLLCCDCTWINPGWTPAVNHNLRAIIYIPSVVATVGSCFGQGRELASPSLTTEQERQKLGDRRGVIRLVPAVANPFLML
eukprot:2179646-Amphidinium_carterae.1